ncbi:MAG: outer membrane beta-barrel protein [Hyphomicrobiales bacterium]
MKTLVKYSVAVLGLSLLSTGAIAADLPPAPQPAVAPSAWSFSVFGGASWMNDVKSDETVTVPRDSDGIFDPGAIDPAYLSKERWSGDAKFDTGFLVGGTFGYSFVNWARTEVEVAYQNYDIKSIDVGFAGCKNTDCTDNVDVNGQPTGGFSGGGGSIDAVTIMGNVWFGFNMLPFIGDPVNNAGSGLGFSPYFGGGLGVAFVNGNSNGDFNLDENATALAWQVGAGVRWMFANNIGLDLGYRYRGINNVNFSGLDRSFDLTSNNVILGLTFNF